MPSSSADYPEYLRLCLTYQKQPVLERDLSSLLTYLRGEAATCHQVDPGFTHMKNLELTKLMNARKAEAEKDTSVKEENQGD